MKYTRSSRLLIKIKEKHFMFGRIYLLFLLITTMGFPIYSQNYIAGTIKDGTGEPVPYANILVLQLLDSSFITGTSTNEVGGFEIGVEDRFAGLLKIMALGYSDKYIRLDPAQTEYHIVIDQSFVELDEVTVTGKKMLYELKRDRIVMNIGSSPTMSGNTGLQILQRVPGVMVDKQSNSIAIPPKGELLIMINNKIQRLPKEVLMAQLEGIRAENIERIELIQQPPAKYDASGSAGILHIVLKKNEAYGTNGNASLTAGYGKKEKFGMNVGLNANKGIFNVYGSYNYNLDRRDDFIVNHFREYDYLDTKFYHENFVNLGDIRSEQHSGNIGLDLNISSKTILGFLMNLSTSDWTNNGMSNSSSFVNDQLKDKSDLSLSQKDGMFSAFGNVNLSQRLSKSSDLNVNLNYAFITFDNAGNIYDLRNIERNNIHTRRNTPIDIWTMKMDYTNDLTSGSRLEAGIKGTMNDIVSGNTISIPSGSEWSSNNFYSGEDLIKERIVGVYSSIIHDFSDRFDTEIGLRYEYYNYFLNSFIDKDDLEQISNNLFPILRMNYKLDSLNSFQLSLNRTINRPSFSSLSSMFLLLDPSILVYSNPKLKPAFTNTYKFTWQYRRILLSLAYINTVNKVDYHNTVDKESDIQTSTPINFDRSDILEANLSFPISIGEWWETSFNLTSFWETIKDKSSRTIPFEKDLITFSVQLNSSFKFGKDWTVSMDGRYMSPYLGGDQVKYLHPYINAGIRKQLSSNSSLSLSVQDISNSSGIIEWEYHQPELGIRTFGYNDGSERQIRLTYSYNFGNQKIAQKRTRETGLKEVRDRM